MAKESPADKLKKIMAETEAQKTPKAKKGGGLKIQLGVRHINLLLLVLCLASIALLAYEFKSGMDLLNTNVSIPADESVQNKSQLDPIPQVQKIGHYLSYLDERNIFAPYEMKKASKSTPGQRSLAKRMSHYRLVGVSWLDLPESASVMLEDSTDGTTHFLKEGDKIEDVTLKTIYVDRAVFSYENEEITIKL